MTRHIAIAGDLGSGKSTVARILCRKLGYSYFSTGTLQRKLAAERGMNTLEMNYFAETTKSIDEYIDAQLKRIGSTEGGERYVLDSRLAWHFVPGALKIYLTVQPGIAAQRVLTDTERQNEPSADSLEERGRTLQERQTVENRRFKNLYGVDCQNPGNYDAVIDTSCLSAEAVAERIILLL